MSQLDLLLAPVGVRFPARSDGPETSAKAAQDVVSVPSRHAERQAKALAAVRRWPGSTALELANKSGESDPRGINRRLSELRRGGLVRNGEPRACTISGKAALTWVAT